MGVIFDPIFKGIATLLAACYSFTHNYALTIAVFTLIIMVAFTPLTLKSTRSMMAMQRLQPQIKQLQARYKDDRQTLNTEMMALYQKEGVNPLGGCLPMLVQLPVFFILFRVLNGLTRIGEDGNFDPDYLDLGTELYKDLHQTDEMLSFGVDLARQANEVVQDSIGKSIPFLILVVITAITSWYQQRQMASRRTGDLPQQQQMLMKIMPWMLPVFSFFMPAGIVVYFIVSNLYRVGQQAYIHKKMPPVDPSTLVIDTDEAPSKKASPSKKNDAPSRDKSEPQRAPRASAQREGKSPSRPRPQPRQRKSRPSSASSGSGGGRRGDSKRPASDSRGKPRPTSRTGGADGMNRPSNKKKRKR